MVLVMEVVMVTEETEHDDWQLQEWEQEWQVQVHDLLKVEGQPIVVEDWQAGNDIAPLYL
jgi:hypothetical protein